MHSAGCARSSYWARENACFSPLALRAASSDAARSIETAYSSGNIAHTLFKVRWPRFRNFGLDDFEDWQNGLLDAMWWSLASLLSRDLIGMISFPAAASTQLYRRWSSTPRSRRGHLCRHTLEPRCDLDLWPKNLIKSSVGARIFNHNCLCRSWDIVVTIFNRKNRRAAQRYSLKHNDFADSVGRRRHDNMDINTSAFRPALGALSETGVHPCVRVSTPVRLLEFPTI